MLHIIYVIKKDMIIWASILEYKMNLRIFKNKKEYLEHKYRLISIAYFINLVKKSIINKKLYKKKWIKLVKQWDSNIFARQCINPYEF